jgi:hypothetical protein
MPIGVIPLTTPIGMRMSTQGHHHRPAAHPSTRVRAR